MMCVKDRGFLFVLVLLSVWMAAQSAMAQGRGMSIIRDTEIEETLRGWSAPIFRAAGLDPDGVNIILVQSDTMNAFVAGGSNIFLYTGLIEKTENPGELIGVIAHETGHIAGGHLIRTREALERASYESIIGAVIGVGAAIASGQSGAASAGVIGSNSIAQRRFLAHSRVQESSADQAALRFMQQAKIDPSGLVSFMEKLRAEITIPQSQQSEYIQTHPLVENRIEVLARGVADSPYRGQGYPENWSAQHARMKAKLVGFITPTKVPWVYDDRDTSIPATYARAIAAYRTNKVEAALKAMDDLLARAPQDPYFMELKGQMLVDFGRGEEAITYYRRAIEKKPQAALMRIALGHALIEVASRRGNDVEMLKEAVKELELSLDREPRSGRVHRLLATAYGRLGDEPMAKVHLAEEAVLQKRNDYAKSQAEAALRSAPEGSKAWLRAKDVLSFLESAKDR